MFSFSLDEDLLVNRNSRQATVSLECVAPNEPHLFIDDMLDCFSTVHNPLSGDSAHLQYNLNEFWGIKRGTMARFHSMVYKCE